MARASVAAIVALPYTVQMSARSRVGQLALALVFASAGPAVAWTPESQAAIAAQAAELAPSDLRSQIEKHPKELRRGALEAFRDADPGRHWHNADGSGTLDVVIATEAAHAVAAIEAHRPFADIVYRLGRLSHFVADASNPLNASDVDPGEANYFVDFLRYAESATPRMAVVFYGFDGKLDRATDLRPLAAAALSRSRALYPSVGAEYRRIGRIAGRQLFDDRSTAFALAAISFSHAVSDVANAFRFVWLKSGGADVRPVANANSQRLLLVHRHSEAKTSGALPAASGN
jgi:hypothetical protein